MSNDPDDEDEGHCEEPLMMRGMGRAAEKREIPSFKLFKIQLEFITMFRG